MLKRLSVVLGLLLAGCGRVDPPHQAGPQPLSQQELDTLPADEIGRRIALQLELTVVDDPNWNGRNKLSERKRRYNMFLQGRGYAEGDICRRDVLIVRYEPRPNAASPAMARGFFSEATYARLKDYPGATDCNDKRLSFFRATSMETSPSEAQVARRAMDLFDRARSSPKSPVTDCGFSGEKPRDCRALLMALPVSHLRKVSDCPGEAIGACAYLDIDEWELTIRSGDGGAIESISLFDPPSL